MLHLNTPMPNILPAFTHCRLCFPFAASLPHLNCLGLGQQISSTSWNFPLWLHPWPLQASFFTFSTTSQPSRAAFFICFGMKTWLQLVAEVVRRGRGGEAAGLARVGSKALLCVSGLPKRGIHGWKLWSWGGREERFLFLLQIKSRARTWALHHVSFSPGSQLVLPSCFLPAQWKPTSAVAKENTAKGHSQSPDRSWDSAGTAWAKPCVTRNLWNDFKKAEICRSRSPGKLSFSSPWRGRKLWACISHLTVPRPISR